MKEFLVGSKVFFSVFEDFNAVDTDILIIDDDPDYPVEKSYMEGNIHYIRWRNFSKEQLIQEHRYIYKGRYIQKFLVPEFIEYIGLTIDDLKELGFMIPFLDDQHNYVKVIYDAYIENNGFYLTQEQLEEAYRVYKEDRKDLYE